MAVLRLARFTTDPADTGEMLARRAALIAAVRDGFPGLVEAPLAKVDDKTWIDVWRWNPRSSAKTAIANSSTIPEAAATFSLTSDVSMEFAEVVDER